MALVSFAMKVRPSEVEGLVCDVLDPLRLDGVAYTVRMPRWWDFWSDARVKISGPPGVVEALKRKVSAWQFDRWGEQQI
jgi:hypothetical protein